MARADDFIDRASKLFGCKELVYDKRDNDSVGVRSREGKIYGTVMRSLLELAEAMNFLCYIDFIGGSVVFYSMF